MTDQTFRADAASPLKASKLQWPRLWRLFRNGALVSAGAAAIALYMSGGSLLLQANGLVTRDRVRVASPFEARITEVFVHPGDPVKTGQKIARVESGSIVRTLSDIATERARLASRVAQLRTRRDVIKSTLPIAENSARQADAFLGELMKAKEKGLAVWRSTQEISAANVIAADKAAGLRAERDSLEAELATNHSALEETSKAYDSLKRAYNDGMLISAHSGVVGPMVAVAGEVLTGQNSVTDIYTGASYVLAYMPDGYLFDVTPGQPVCVKAYNRIFNARIDRILPVTEAVPPEFQMPVKVRDRGQLAKIALTGETTFAIGQKINVTASLTPDCEVGLGGVVKQVTARLGELIQVATSKVVTPATAKANTRGQT
jgi:multidrug resistance efflux pump